jgi:hypothetical protein
MGIRFQLWLAGLVLAAAPSVSRAAVTLIFDDGDALPGNSLPIAPGGTFQVSVFLNSTQEETTGLNYFLSAPGAGSNHFQITARDTTGTLYSDLTNPDNSTTTGVLTPARARLDPQNNDDLGGGLQTAQINNPPGVGRFLVAKYTIQVLPGTNLGNYSILTTSDAGKGWVGSNNDPSGIPFSDHPFTNQGGTAYTVTVTPEPAALGLLSMAVLVLGARRRRRR